MAANVGVSTLRLRRLYLTRSGSAGSQRPQGRAQSLLLSFAKQQSYNLQLRNPRHPPGEGDRLVSVQKSSCARYQRRLDVRFHSAVLLSECTPEQYTRLQSTWRTVQPIRTARTRKQRNRNLEQSQVRSARRRIRTKLRVDRKDRSERSQRTSTLHLPQVVLS